MQGEIKRFERGTWYGFEAQFEDGPSHFLFHTERARELYIKTVKAREDILAELRADNARLRAQLANTWWERFKRMVFDPS